MKKSFILAMALMVAGCSAGLKDEITVNKTVTLNVNISQDEVSRTELDTNSETASRETHWTAGDQISVNGQVIAVPENVIGTKNGFEISGVAEADEYVIVYPADAYKNGNVEILTNQVYKENNFAEGSAILLAKTDNATRQVSLKNVCGFIKLEISKKADEQISRIVLSSNDQSPISGIFRTNFDGERPVIESVSGSSAINITGINYDTEGKCEVIVAVPAGTYAEGITGKVYDNNGKFTQLNFGKGNTYEVEAGIVKKSEFTFTGSGTVSERVITDADDFALWLADEAAACTSSDVVLMCADIDMDGKTVTPAASFAGTFDGQGYSIKNWDTTKPLFTVIAATGTVKNVVIDKSCFYNCVTTNGYDGFIAGKVSGKIINCVNNGDMKAGDVGSSYCGCIVGFVDKNGYVSKCINNGNFTIEQTRSESIQCAGITSAINTKGLVESCVNNGNIYMTTEEHINSHYLSGVVARMYGVDNVVKVKDCHNYGSVTLIAATQATEELASGQLIGGVVGGSAGNKGSATAKENYTKNYGGIEGCTNNGPINVSSGYKGGYFCIGGVVGHIEGWITKCVNNASVSFINDIDDQNCTRAGIGVGGVAGKVTGKMEGSIINASDCLNYGDITVQTITSNASQAYNAYTGGITWSSFGGCFGCVYDNTNEMANCKNYGTIYVKNCGVSNNGSSNATGGVAGAIKCKATNCYNYGNITNDSPTVKTSYVGGISGYAYGAFDVINSANKGKIEIKNSTIFTYIGGIIGYITSNRPIKNCTQIGDLTITGEQSDNTNGGIGGIVGLIGDSKGCNISDCKAYCNIQGKGFVSMCTARFNGTKGAISTKAAIGGTVNGTTITSSNVSTMGYASNDANATSTNHTLGFTYLGTKPVVE